MLKTRFKILLLSICFLFVFSTFCFANNETNIVKSEKNTENSQTSENTEETTMPQILTYDKFLISTGDVVVNGLIDGNVIAIGKNVKVEAATEINGDLAVLATESLIVEESAKVYANFFAFSPNFTMNGMASNVYTISTQFTLGKTGFIYRDLRIFCDYIDINGIINRDAYIFANKITLPQNSGNLIGRNFNYTSNNEIQIPKGFANGEINFTQINGSTTGKIILNYLYNFCLVITYAIVVILLAIWLAPKFIEKTSYMMTKKPLISASVGILALILTPILSILIAFISIFVYISFGTLAVYILILSITLPILSMAIAEPLSNKLKNKTKVKFVLISIGIAIVLYLLQLIPFIGNYISIFILVFGLGIFVMALFRRKALSKEETVEDSKK